VPDSCAPGSVAGPFSSPDQDHQWRPAGATTSRRTRRPQRLRLPEPREPTATNTPHNHLPSPRMPQPRSTSMTRITVNKPPSPGSAAETHRSSDAPGRFMLQLTATRRTRSDLAYTNRAEAVFRRSALSITLRRVGRPYNAFRPCPDANGADHGRRVRTTSTAPRAPARALRLEALADTVKPEERSRTARSGVDGRGSRVR
jgi:hypothetical protein